MNMDKVTNHNASLFMPHLFCSTSSVDPDEKNEVLHESLDCLLKWFKQTDCFSEKYDFEYSCLKRAFYRPIYVKSPFNPLYTGNP